MYEVIDWIHPAQNVERFHAVVDTKVNVFVSIKGRASYEQTSDHQFLKMNSLHLAHFLPQ
jgi:hypothetical protein